MKASIYINEGAVAKKKTARASILGVPTYCCVLEKEQATCTIV